MFMHIMRFAAALVCGTLLNGVAYSQVWEIEEIFSTADGSVQFITLRVSVLNGTYPPLAGRTLIASDGKTQHSFTFATDANLQTHSDCIDGCALSSTALVATQRFADINLLKPDFVVPNGFLFVPSGFLQLGVRQFHYTSLPDNGFLAFYIDPLFEVGQAVAYNTAGEFYWFIKDEGIPEGINPLVEYYNLELDDYFVTAYPTEIQSFDAGSSPTWQRTNHGFSAWTSSFSVGATPPPNLAPACRVWLGDSHLYSIAPSECFPATPRPGSIIESQAAFFATLPNSGTGTCPANQTRVYRLWNPRGSGHRYTTETGIRDEMLARGWIAEGYGPDRVAMCVGGNG